MSFKVNKTFYCFKKNYENEKKLSFQIIKPMDKIFSRDVSDREEM